MATVAGIAAGLGLGFKKKNSNPSTTFLGKKLQFRISQHGLSGKKSTSPLLVSCSGGEWEFVRHLFLGVGVGLPCTVMECGDIIYRSTLPRSSGFTVTAPGAVLALGVLSYLWATPGVAPGFFDMFVLAFIERVFRPTFRKDDLVLGKKLGEGAFGVVYKASVANDTNSKVVTT